MPVSVRQGKGRFMWQILFDTSSVRYQSTRTSHVAIFLKRAGPKRSDQFGFFSGFDFEQILN
jgi:hypothetical protein